MSGSIRARTSTIAVAGRMSPVSGRVIERGTHEELMRAGGTYHEMVLRQMAADEQGAGALWS